ncbi:putative adhesin [Mobilisporobacter senegalensis]|uniref:Putative adhesin n=1 Tax=Mobilisporobacter senegalensis TaxID=1329262 RepID=A0A3N1XKE3_9FIRM|nr:DUF4097 family beta strand repeat-containing protein [Mobilisporobacter senegalensis]ROR27189.1 putative adhesin [Mobilisporobacter senegalensis]
MKSFYKVCAKVALGLIGIGIILTIIGITSGASWYSLNVGPFRIHDRIINRDNNNNNINDNNSNNSSDSLKETYSGVKSVDIDIHYGEVLIKKGEEFAIESKNISRNNLKSYMDGDTWRVEDKSNYNINFFGIHIGNDGIDINNRKSSITIFIPENFNGEKINISLGAGEIEIDEISGDEVTFDVGAGRMQVNKLVAYKEADLTVGAGKINIDNIQAEETDIECGMGNITIKGVIAGDSNVECGVGQISMYLDGQEEDYNYYIDSGVGNVIINDDEYTFTSSTKKVNDNAEFDFNINCGVGNVTIKVD